MISISVKKTKSNYVLMVEYKNDLFLYKSRINGKNSWVFFYYFSRESFCVLYIHNFNHNNLILKLLFLLNVEFILIMLSKEKEEEEKKNYSQS
ncbi:hypothetical protein BpHYR1_041368 [Brachionus plicatilis]|uniref:Uncharacterized protein n=1 Tax=Brachionus plicatilis TaxID=10195 RepID=A0A3M7SLF6_BRAPC|nr:hypothetical protein BpHYR1_041368 [Brachionus plicatilis]